MLFLSCQDLPDEWEVICKMETWQRKFSTTQSRLWRRLMEADLTTCLSEFWFQLDADPRAHTGVLSNLTTAKICIHVNWHFTFLIPFFYFTHFCTVPFSHTLICSLIISYKQILTHRTKNFKQEPLIDLALEHTKSFQQTYFPNYNLF